MHGYLSMNIIIMLTNALLLPYWEFHCLYIELTTQKTETSITNHRKWWYNYAPSDNTYSYKLFLVKILQSDVL